MTQSGYIRIFTSNLLLAVLFLISTPLSADCMSDPRGDIYCGAGDCVVNNKGRVWCSRYYNGDAAITLYGQVLCGKGQCAKGLDGQFFCSSEIGGAVLLDSHGRVRCYGSCEPATADKCENTRADYSGR